jgi:diacylglycerol kinase family enzyme
VHGYTDKIHIGRAEYQPLPKEQRGATAIEADSDAASPSPEHRLFLFGAGVGFDAYACLRVNLQIKHFARAAAYVLDGFRLLLKYRSPKLEVITDNHPPIECAEVIVSNTRHYAGQFKIAPEASFHDPNFDACLMLRPGKWNLMRYAWGIIRGRIVHLPDVQVRKVQTVEVRAKTRAFFHIDGDTVGTPPVRLTLLLNALTVIVPQG